MQQPQPIFIVSVMPPVRIGGTVVSFFDFIAQWCLPVMPWKTAQQFAVLASIANKCSATQSGTIPFSRIELATLMDAMDAARDAMPWQTYIRMLAFYGAVANVTVQEAQATPPAPAPSPQSAPTPETEAPRAAN